MPPHVNDNEEKKQVCGKFVDFSGNVGVHSTDGCSLSHGISGKTLYPKSRDGLSDADIIAQPDGGMRKALRRGHSDPRSAARLSLLGIQKIGRGIQEARDQPQQYDNGDPDALCRL